MAPSELLLPWLPWLVTFSSVLAIIFLLDLAIHARRRNNTLPPGPRPLPLIGSLHLLGAQPHRSLARLARAHGPLMSLRLGAVTTVVASSPAAAAELLQKHDAAFASRSAPDSLRRHARNSVAWLPAGSPRWRALRKLMSAEMFAPHRLDADALRRLRQEKVSELADHVAATTAAAAPVRVGLVVFTTMLNLLSRTIFSCDLAGLDDDHGGESREFYRVVLEIFEAAGCTNVSDFFPALAAADLQGRRRLMEKLLGRLHQVFDREVEQRLSGRSDNGAGVGERTKNEDFLDLLLNAAAVDDDGAAVLDRDTLRSMFSDLFAAGTDTSSSTVEWAMAELLRNPLSMAKARDELRRLTAGTRRNIEESEISQLPYLQAVVKETFRLHPPVPFLLPREAVKTTKVMGYTIPKGSRVLVNVWAIGRDANVWSEPDKFMPERFLANAAVDFRGGDFELIPFGAGRRVCPGLPLAVRMVHLVLGSLLNQFEWRLPEEEERDGVDMSENFGLTLVKAVPLRAIPARV